MFWPQVAPVLGDLLQGFDQSRPRRSGIDQFWEKPMKISPAIELVYRRPGDLKPWPGNPRTHSEKQLVKLKASITKFGFTAPVLVDESSVILSGHARTTAALELKLPEIPTRVIAGRTPSMKRALVVADNKLAQLSTWDETLLRQELELLIKDDFEIEITGFDTAELDLMFAPAENSQGSEPDDLQAEDIPPDSAEYPIVSRAGDLWRPGNHLLLCGDALDRQSYEEVMRGDTAQMVITDPPYNVPINGHVCGSGKVKHADFMMGAGEMSSGQFIALLGRSVTNMAAVSQDGAIHFLFIDWRHISELLAAAAPVFGAPKQLCVWSKDNAGMGTFYRSQHELVFVFKKGNAPHVNNFELGQNGRYRTNVWNYAGVNTFTGKGYELLALHPTVKPTALIADAIRDCSHRNGLILDPFAGSGTILIAAERTGRHARAIELDARYVDVALNRWIRVTGVQPLLDGTGQTWEQVRRDRLGANE
jgi:DNA modification methylase